MYLMNITYADTNITYRIAVKYDGPIRRKTAKRGVICRVTMADDGRGKWSAGKCCGRNKGVKERGQERVTKVKNGGKRGDK